MTTDIKLTPSSVAAFTEALKGESGSLDAWLEVNDESEVAAHIEAYASACVSRAIAEKDAEIDRLRTRLEDTVRDSTNKIEAPRAEVKSLQTLRDVVIENHGYWKGRAERLAEALRKILDNEAPDWKFAEEFGGYVLDDALREEALAALEQEEGSGYWPEMPKNGGPDWTGHDG